MAEFNVQFDWLRSKIDKYDKKLDDVNSDILVCADEDEKQTLKNRRDMLLQAITNLHIALKELVEKKPGAVSDSKNTSGGSTSVPDVECQRDQQVSPPTPPAERTAVTGYVIALALLQLMRIIYSETCKAVVQHGTGWLACSSEQGAALLLLLVLNLAGMWMEHAPSQLVGLAASFLRMLGAVAYVRLLWWLPDWVPHSMVFKWLSVLPYVMATIALHHLMLAAFVMVAWPFLQFFWKIGG